MIVKAASVGTASEKESVVNTDYVAFLREKDLKKLKAVVDSAVQAIKKKSLCQRSSWGK